LDGNGQVRQRTAVVMVVRRVVDALVRGRAATLQSIWGDTFADLNPHVALWACATHTD